MNYNYIKKLKILYKYHFFLFWDLWVTAIVGLDSIGSGPQNVVRRRNQFLLYFNHLVFIELVRWSSGWLPSFLWCCLWNLRTWSEDSKPSFLGFMWNLGAWSHHLSCSNVFVKQFIQLFYGRLLCLLYAKLITHIRRFFVLNLNFVLFFTANFVIPWRKLSFHPKTNWQWGE